MKDVRKFYIDTYHDQFFISPPAWFTMYIWMELFYHVPLSIWAIGALLRGESWSGSRSIYRALNSDPNLTHELSKILLNAS